MPVVQPSPREGAAPSGVAQVIHDGDVRTVFQPIIDLETGDAVAHEALSRGPDGPLHHPMDLFAAASRDNLLAELDRVCLLSALRAAGSGLSLPSTIFVNVEPQVLDATSLEEAARLVDGFPGLSVVLEITERSLAARPSELLRAIERVRELGWGVALDDVGVDSASLAFMPLLLPDVIKLDLSVVQRVPDHATAKVMHAVNAHAERTGARVLAEGIETEGHESASLALGATLGQGYRYGRPAETPMPGVAGLVLHEAPRPPAALLTSPFGFLPPGTRVHRAPKRLLVEVSKHLEREAARVGETCIVTAAFQHARHFTPATARRYGHLAERTGFVCALGEGLTAEPQAGVRGADLASDDPLREEWDLTVLGPHCAMALLARDLGGDTDDLDRMFEYALTYKRSTVIDATRSLVSRVGFAA